MKTNLWLGRRTVRKSPAVFSSEFWYNVFDLIRFMYIFYGSNCCAELHIKYRSQDLANAEGMAYGDEFGWLFGGFFFNIEQIFRFADIIDGKRSN